MKTYHSKRSMFSASLLLFCICLISFSLSPLHAAPLKFAVISDSHIDQNNGGMVLDAIVKEIKKISASSGTPIKHIVVTGDMVFNHQKFSPQTPDSYQQYLGKFLDTIGALLKKTDMKLLIVRGNHDNHYSDDGDHGPYDDAFSAVMNKNKDLLAVPYEKNKPNFNYAVDNVSFIMLNMISLTKNDKSEATADIAWLNQIKKDTKAQTFVFGHYPAFSANSASYAMLNTGPFLDCMAANGYQYYFSGHDHIFAHSILEKKNAEGKVVSVVNQVGSPNSAGGRFSRDYEGKLYATNPGGWEAKLKKPDATFKDKKAGFLVVEVNGQSVEVTAYKMNFDKTYEAALN